MKENIKTKKNIKDNENTEKILENKNTKIKSKRGVTLVALVISIIVLIILSVVTFNLTVGKNGIITRSFEARYMMQLSSYQEELGAFKAVKLMDNSAFEESSITSGENSLIYNTQPEGETGNVYDVITSLRGSNFEGKIEIIKGEIVLNSTDETEIKAAQNVGIEVNPYIIIDGELTSSGANLALMDKNGTLTIPEGVTIIGEGAFADLSGLKTIIIPGTVKEIRQNAFRNNADLETVILQEGVEVIENSAFQECSNLKNIELPESLTEIGEYAFSYDTSLNNVTIPSGITTINTYTFSYCTSLTNIKLSEGLQTIDSYAFQYCNDLEEIYIPSSVTSIGNSVFINCTSLSNIKVASGNLNYKYDEASGMLFTIDGTDILFIADAVLRGTNTLTIPEGITSFNIEVNSYANITKIIIPSSLERIRDAGLFPSSINNVEVAESNNFFTVENECLYNKDKTILRMCFTKGADVELAETVTTIYDYAFKQAVNIVNVDLPDSVTKIVGAQIFPSSLTKLENINIGPNVTYISPIFKLNNYYGTVTIDESNQSYTVEDNELYNKDKTELITVLYKINGQYIVKEGVIEIGNAALRSQMNMTSIVLPEGLKEIGSSFQHTGLTSIYMPNSVEVINSNAFANSANLTQIQIDKEPGSIAGSPWGAIRGDRIVEWLRE